MKISKWIIAGGLGVALLVMCLLMVGITWASIGLARQNGFDWPGFEIDRVSASTDDEQRFGVEAPATLALIGFAGDVTVIGGTTDEMVVTMHKTAWGANQAEAEAELTALHVTLSQAGDTVTVEVTKPDEQFLSGRNNTVDFTISVPTNTAVDVNIDFGDVTISKIEGATQAQVNFGQVQISDVVGDVVARSDFGDLTLTDLRAGQVEARSNAGTISVTDVQATGAVVLDNDFGRVTFERGTAESLSVESSSGNVTLEDLTLTDTVEVNNDFGQVTLTDVDAAAYMIDGNSGTIRVDGAHGPVTIHNDFGQVEVTNATNATLDLKTNSGSVTFSGSLGAGPHTVASDFGEVILSLPADTALDVDLKTDLGSISSAFAVTARGELGNRWQGTINGGGASLTAKTNSGRIALEILKP